MTTPFLSFEGVEGAGKTTLIAGIAAWLDAQGIAYLQTREPGGCSLGEWVRQTVLHDPEIHPVPQAELLLMYAARVQHLQEIILPALQQGRWVLCDRFHDASHAYQGHGRQLGDAPLDWLDQWLLSRMPDCTFLLDLDVEQGRQRVAARKAGEDKMERQDRLFFQRVREGYLRQAAKEPERFVVLDATQSPQDLLQQVQRKLRDWL